MGAMGQVSGWMGGGESPAMGRYSEGKLGWGKLIASL